MHRVPPDPIPNPTTSTYTETTILLQTPSCRGRLAGSLVSALKYLLSIFYLLCTFPSLVCKMASIISNIVSFFQSSKNSSYANILTLVGGVYITAQVLGTLITFLKVFVLGGKSVCSCLFRLIPGFSADWLPFSSVLMVPGAHGHL